MDLVLDSRTTRTSKMKEEISFFREREKDLEPERKSY